MSVQVAAAQVRNLVCLQSANWPAAAECCRELTGRGSGVIEGRKVPASDLKRIYERRLSKSPESVQGGDRLLRDLRGFSGDTILLVALESRERVFCLLLDEDATNLVSCFVGTDKRFFPQ